MNRQAVSKYKARHGFDRLAPRLFLFDMDGVLYNSMPNHAKAWVRSMASFGLEMTEEDAYLTEGQKGTDTIAQMVLKQKGTTIGEEEAQSMYDAKAKIYAQLPPAEVMPGIIDLMKGIQAQGWEIGVVTGSGQMPLISRICIDFAPFVSRDHIVTAYDVKHGKPHPDPYLRGMEKFGVEHPWEVVVVENAPLGVKSGVAAQCFTVGVNTGILKRKDLSDAGADLVFDSMQEFAGQWDKFLSLLSTFDENWYEMYAAVADYLAANHRRPSKYRKEDARLHNWLKYNTKMLHQGKLTGKREQLFRELKAALARNRRVNQYAYLVEEGTLDFPE